MPANPFVPCNATVQMLCINGTVYILKYIHIYVGSFIIFISLTPDSFTAGFTSGDGEVSGDGCLLVSDDPILLIPQGRPNSCGCMHATINHPARLGDGYMKAT